MTDTTSPLRRSAVELQEQLNSIFDSLPASKRQTSESGEQACSMDLLPSLLAAFEKRKGITLLTAEEMEGLKVMASQAQDLVVSASDLVQVFSQLTQSTRSQSPSPVGGEADKPLPEPPSSPVSIGSGISSEDRWRGRQPSEQELEGEGSYLLSPPLPPTTPQSAFPRSMSHNDALGSSFKTPSRSAAHHRAKTVTLGLEHETSFDNPFASRQRSSPLDLTPTDVSRRPAIRRPAAHKARKPSQDASPRSRSREDNHETLSPPLTETRGSPAYNDMHWPDDTEKVHFPHSVSMPELRETSHGEAVAVDGTSFHSHPLSSPPAVPLDNPSQADLASLPLFREGSLESVESASSDGSHSRPGSQLLRAYGINANGSGGLSYRPDSFSSINSLVQGMGNQTSSEDIQHMLKLLADSSKKVKELERANEANSLDQENTLFELQSRLDEAQIELSTRKKEEKEWRGKEKSYLSQIAEFEAETGRVQKSLDKQRELYGNIKKQLDEQREETDKLRDSIRGKEQDLRFAEEAGQVANGEVARMMHEQGISETTIKKLEEDLVEARQVRHSLDLQKLENGKLKNTIDSLKLEVEALTARIRLHSSSSASLTGNSPQRATATHPSRRTLGSEMHTDSDIASTDESSDGDVTEDEESVKRSTDRSKSKSKGKRPEGVYEKHIIYRTRHVTAGQTLQSDTNNASSATSSSSDPQDDQTFESIEQLADLVDDATQTDLVRVDQRSIQTEPVDDPPSYAESHQKDLIFIRPNPFGRHLEVWTRQIPYANTIIPRISPVCHAAMSLALESTPSFILYSTVCLLLGTVGGFSMSALFNPVPNDHQLWLSYNTLHPDNPFMSSGSSGWSYWFQEFLYSSVSVARRVPT